MGPIIRRKKVVSMPLGAQSDFFYGDRRGVPVGGYATIDETASAADGSVTHPLPHFDHAARARQRNRQNTAPTGGAFFGGAAATAGTSTPAGRPRRTKTNSFVAGVLTRRAAGLDLVPAEEAELGVYEFFRPETATVAAPAGLDHGEETKEEVVDEEAAVEEGTAEVSADEVGAEEGEVRAEAPKPKKKLFKPLVFAPRTVPKGGGGGHGGHGGGHAVVAQPKEKTERTETATASAHTSIAEAVPLTKGNVAQDGDKQIEGSDEFHEDESLDLEEEFDDSHIIRATRKDYFFTGILVCLMAALVGVAVGWHTHLDETDAIFGPVGLACKTPCRGDIYDQDYFNGQYRFENGDVILLRPHIDTTLTENSFLKLIIRGIDTNTTKWESPNDMFGPATVQGGRVTIDERVTVNWDHPEERHVIDVLSTTGSQEVPPAYYDSYIDHESVSHEVSEATDDHGNEIQGDAQDRRLSSGGTEGSGLPDVPHHGELTYTLYVSTLAPLAEQSVLIAALIMIFVYIFILLEVIHRTLVAIFGSMVALFFFFIMHNGHTESISTLMLHMEWSTLGLLFGMMLMVGELSHTGVFEWCAVRLLVASKGSFNRLMILLCSLVALSSAFLDNVTTMLLIAPVTIDMCNILGVDPRPYLIGEVLLSNVGGTATLIGDPPNIIIGSSFDEIGFVDFIINVLPCIFFFCVPATLILVLQIYKYYLSTEKMATLDVRTLKKTYQVYDEPRLLIAGTTTFFVILIFFLHPVHHKDTAWIALIGAFITIAFTNPHDVQDALRNHVEWDTLLFFAGLFVLVEVCAAMGLLTAIGSALASVIKSQPEEDQLTLAITLILWVSAITSAFLDNIPYTATMIPVVKILADELPDTLPVKTLAWALSFGACLGGNGTLLGASANIVTAGLSTSKGFGISFLNFLYPGMLVMFVTVAIANLYMLIVYVWI